MEATLTIADVAENIDVEPVIDLTRSTNPHSLLLNVQAELQIMENRERNAARRSRDLGDRASVLVRLGFDYTPGVGWHSGEKTPGVTGTRPERPAQPVAKAQVIHTPHGPAAVFRNARTGEKTIVCTDGTVPVGNALNEPHAPGYWERWR